jgi:hypothetical protein
MQRMRETLIQNSIRFCARQLWLHTRLGARRLPATCAELAAALGEQLKVRVGFRNGQKGSKRHL